MNKWFFEDTSLKGDINKINLGFVRGEVNLTVDIIRAVLSNIGLKKDIKFLSIFFRSFK